MTHDSAPESNRLTIRILLALLVVVALVAGLVAVFGLPALGILGMVLTLVFFAVMLSFTAGN